MKSTGGLILLTFVDFFGKVLINATILPAINGRKYRHKSDERDNLSSTEASSLVATAAAANQNLIDHSILPVIQFDEEKSCGGLIRKGRKQRSNFTMNYLPKSIASLPALFTTSKSSQYRSTSGSNDASTASAQSSKSPLSIRNIGSSKAHYDHLVKDMKLAGSDQQLTQAVDKLIEIMAVYDQSSSSPTPPMATLKSSSSYKADLEYNLDTLRMRKRTDDITSSLRQISDPRILEVMAAFPLKGVSQDEIFRAVDRIWTQVKTISHHAIFSLVSTWAIKIFEECFPSDYFLFLDYVVYADLQFETYARAVESAHLLSLEEVAHLIQRIQLECLVLKDSETEYEFYGKFNIYFLFLAKNYPGFWKIDYIKNFQLKDLIVSTPTLEFIYKSIGFLQFLPDGKNGESSIISENFSRYLHALVDLCDFRAIPTSLLVEQIDLILTHNLSAFEGLDSTSRVVLLSLLADSIGALARIQSAFPSLQIHHAVFAICLKNNLNNLLKILLGYFPTFFNQEEFDLLLDLVDRGMEESSFNTLLTFFGNITIDSFDLLKVNKSANKSLAIRMALDIIRSIAEQNLSTATALCSPTRSASKSSKLFWTLPEIISSSIYEHLSISDFLMIPLLFIKRVFNSDYRKSKLIDKYRHTGKPSYHHLAIIINEILESQCHQIYYQYPILEVVIVFPGASKDKLVCERCFRIGNLPKL